MEGEMTARGRAARRAACRCPIRMLPSELSAHAHLQRRDGCRLAGGSRGDDGIAERANARTARRAGF